MTTDTSRRAEANRRNAQRSCGPRSTAGKARSRFNALKHGLRAKSPILPGEDAQALQARIDAWTADFEPRDEVERFLIERAANISWQLDRADRAQAAKLGNAHLTDPQAVAEEAEFVAALGRGFFWDPRGPLCFYPHPDAARSDSNRTSWSPEADDPNDPARIVAQLEGLMLGCAWMLERWGELRTILEDGLNWQPPDRFKAIRLLGKQPLDGADDARVMSIYLACLAMDPEGPHGFADVAGELNPKEQARFMQRVNNRDPQARMPADPEAGRSELLAMIVKEEDRLEKHLDVLMDRATKSAIARLEFDLSDSGERLRRYQISLNRTLLRIIHMLHAHRKDAGIGGSRKARPMGPRTARRPPASALVNPASYIEADDPTPAVSSESNGSADHDDLAGGMAEMSQATPVSHEENATNEPKSPAPTGGRPGMTMPSALLALLALFFSSGLTLDVAPIVEADRPASPQILQSAQERMVVSSVALVEPAQWHGLPSVVPTDPTTTTLGSASVAFRTVTGSPASRSKGEWRLLPAEARGVSSASGGIASEHTTDRESP